MYSMPNIYSIKDFIEFAATKIIIDAGLTIGITKSIWKSSN